MTEIEEDNLTISFIWCPLQLTPNYTSEDKM